MVKTGFFKIVYEMKVGVVIVILLGFCEFISSQNNSSYLFEHFESATVVFANGGRSNEKINYNLIDHCLYFIDKTDNQIKLVSSVSEIRLLEIENQKFVIDNDGLKQLLCLSPLVYVQVKAKVRNDPEVIGYGGTNEIASANTYSEFRSGGQISTLKSTTFNVSHRYNVYWILKKNKLKMIATFKDLLKVYAENSEKVRKFIADNHLEFDNSTHFVEIIIFAESL